jgi:cobalt-zinc-cadmium resistance protein CzcA
MALRIQEAAREVGRPVFYAVLIIIIVFAPLFTLEGVEGKLFQPMAQSIVLAMLASLVVALVVVPALASYSFRHAIVERDSPLMKPLARSYRKTLRWAQGHRGMIVASALGLFVLSLIMVPFLGTEFVPELEEGTLNIRVTLAPSSSLDTALKVTGKLEAELISFPEVLYATTGAGIQRGNLRRPEAGVGVDQC